MTAYRIYAGSGLTRYDVHGAIRPMDEDERLALGIAAAAEGIRRFWRAVGVPALIAGAAYFAWHGVWALTRVSL